MQPFWSITAVDTIRIAKNDGIVELRRLGQENAGFEISLLPHRSDLYIPRKSCRTTLPLDVIEFWLERADFAWFCDVVGRHEDQTTVARVLKRQLFGYFALEEFVGKRLLDFGCGSGASTFAIAAMLPETEVIGVELSPDRIEIANCIKSSRGLRNVEFRCSPAPDQLPPDSGYYDFVMLSAVYEHLLPVERKTLMPMLWSAIKPGGVMFVNQTPYRYSPYEAHSTGLWFINYLPDSLTHWTVRHFAGRNDTNRSEDWNVHLRGGLRGGTEKEIIRNLTGGDVGAARILQPRHDGIRDRADLWLSGTNPRRHRMLKQCIASFFRFTDRVGGTIPAINLEVTIQKCR